MIIGIGGELESGKDTAAEPLIEHYGFIKKSFGDFVRRECAQALQDDNFPASMPRSIWLQQSSPSSVWIKPTTPAVRQLLQWWGNDYRRAQDPDYWVKQMHKELDAYRDKNVVIPDVRYPNERGLIKLLGGVVFRVYRFKREKSSATQHQSEQFCRQADQFDFTLYNNCEQTTFKLLAKDVVRCCLELDRLKQDQQTNIGNIDWQHGCMLGTRDWEAELSTILRENQRLNPLYDNAILPFST